MGYRQPTSDTESLNYVWTDSVDLTKSKSYETEHNDNGNEVFIFCGKEVSEPAAATFFYSFCSNP